MFAEALPDPNSPAALGWAVLILGAFASIAVNVITIWKLNSTQKREVSFSEEYARRDEVESLRDDVNDLRQEAKQTREKILQEGRDRATKIYQHIDGVRHEVKQDATRTHERIDEVLQAVSELKGRLTK